VLWLFFVLFVQGLFPMLFSQMRVLAAAIPVFLISGILVDMASGATYSVLPFVNKKALRAVAGIVGAGGNAGAFAAGFLFKTEPGFWPTGMLTLGAALTACSLPALTVRLSAQPEPQSETAGAETLPAILEPAMA
jgi:MFS transporter, NNP family, nitrate/nitrite transporter